MSCYQRLVRLAAFHHLAIRVHDLARAERFYTGVLGLAVERRWPWPAEENGRAGERALWLSLTAGFLALEACEGEQPAPPFRDAAPGLHLLALRIAAADRAAWEARFAAHGVPVVHRSRWTLYVQDPEGNRIGLSHHPEDPTVEPAAAPAAAQ